MKPAFDYDHFSHSQLSCYTQCSLKYRFSYIENLEPEFTSSALVFGSSIHSGIQAYLQSVLEADPLRADQLADVFRSEWTGFGGPPVRYSGRETENGLQTKAQELFSLFVDHYDPASEVIAVEESFSIDLNDRIEVACCGPLPPFVGYIDAIIGKDGSTALIDYKTSSRKPNGDLNPMQLVAYSMGASVLGYEPNQLDYRFEYLIKTAKPDFVLCPVKIRDHDRERFLKIVARIWKAIRSSIFYPNPGYLCSSCGYQIWCKEW
ncbi:RecB family exonuclease [Desulfomonile tiedjei]|uniref:PD-(D/E)XK endonuclease-like domain-containing protein n=1 Tax=Desulfomonile tiedjei (strain ATCC 49306 / DSM 6799 / DCB-1) TaxID=706587 RepID=I4C951_DESTA|nr:PD-(D/E)XK nuclease family protein [Desulfomonile tiedjei]AFM26092.1 hypothetical protein Desti_3440 [Desulfomonile tiedjei DSM 6799]